MQKYGMLLKLHRIKKLDKTDQQGDLMYNFSRLKPLILVSPWELIEVAPFRSWSLLISQTVSRSVTLVSSR